MRWFLVALFSLYVVGCGKDVCETYCSKACDKGAVCARAAGYTWTDADDNSCRDTCLDTIEKAQNAGDASEDKRDQVCEDATDTVQAMTCEDYLAALGL